MSRIISPDTGIVHHPQYRVSSSRTRISRVSAGVYVPATSLFSGDDYLVKASSLGSASNKTFLTSFWTNSTTDSNTRYILKGRNGTTGPVVLVRVNATQLIILAQNAASATILNVSLNNALTVASGWQHVMFSVNLAGGVSARHLWIDGVDRSASATWTNYVDDTIVWDRNEWRVGVDDDNTLRWLGSFAELYVTNEYLDLSDSINRSKFYSSGRPVSAGNNGAMPTGNVPLIYLKNPFDSFGTNSGSGGNFTAVGTLEAGPPI